MSFTYLDALSDRLMELLKESEFLDSPFGEAEADREVRAFEIRSELGRIMIALDAPSSVQGRGVQLDQDLDAVIADCHEAVRASSPSAGAGR